MSNTTATLAPNTPRMMPTDMHTASESYLFSLYCSITGFGLADVLTPGFFDSCKFLRPLDRIDLTTEVASPTRQHVRLVVEAIQVKRPGLLADVRRVTLPGLLAERGDRTAHQQGAIFQDGDVMGVEVEQLDGSPPVAARTAA